MPLTDFMFSGNDPLNNALRLLRSPNESELQFFRSKPEVSGYASPDGRIVLNPMSKLSEQEKQSVMMNEFYRLKMRNPLIGRPPPATPGQLARFQNYGGNSDISETMIARMLSGDPTAGEPSFAQRGYADWLRSKK